MKKLKKTCGFFSESGKILAPEYAMASEESVNIFVSELTKAIENNTSSDW